MASKHYLLRGLLAASVLATAGIGVMDAQARSTNRGAGTGNLSSLPALRGAEQPRGAAFSENFDAYAVGSNVHGQGGWKGWFNDPNAGAFVDDAFSTSPSNSINISTSSDLIHEFDQAGGVWIVRAMQYIPGDYAGQSYFIMQNKYDDAGADLNWSVQVQFDSGTGTVLNDGGVSGGSMPYVTDEWIEIRVEIDLDNNIQSFFYDGTLLYSGSWTDQFAPGAGALEIGAIDLFANGASPVYYDDVTITEEGGAPFAVDLAADPVAGNGAPGATVTYSVTVSNTGTTDDTYDLAATGVWTAATSVPTIAVTAGASATFDVTVDVPASATLGDSDVTTITATSQGDPLVEASVDVTTTAEVVDEIFADGFDGEVVAECEPLQLLLDTSFEASGSGSGPWTSTSTNFGSGWCTEATCGVGGGTAGPHTGEVWAWLGGAGGAAETTTASQSVVIPAGSERHLNYWLWIGSVGASGAQMSINVDGSPVDTIAEPAEAELGYSQRTVDLSSFADGASHTIEFNYSTPAGANSNYNLDDVTLECEPSVTQLPVSRPLGPSGSITARIRN